MEEIVALKKQVRELTTLLEVSRSIAQEVDLNRSLYRVVEHALASLEAEAGTLWFMDDDGYLIPQVTIGGDPAGLVGVRMSPGQGIVGSVVSSGEPTIIEDCRADPRWARRTTGFNVHSMLCVPLIARHRPLGAIQIMNRKSGELFTQAELDMLMAVATQAALLIDNARLLAETQKLYHSMVETMSAAVDARDPYTAGHSQRVSQYSCMIARELGLKEEIVEELRIAALLHDMGKIGVRDHILLKQGPLDNDEWPFMAAHAKIGAEILGNLEPKGKSRDIVLAARHHHERIDGRGYPDGLKGDQMTLFARIIAVGDTYDAMTTDRPYRKGLTPAVALAEIHRVAGQQVDAACAEAFVHAMRRHIAESEDAAQAPA